MGVDLISLGLSLSHLGFFICFSLITPEKIREAISVKGAKLWTIRIRCYSSFLFVFLLCVLCDGLCLFTWRSKATGRGLLDKHRGQTS